MTGRPSRQFRHTNQNTRPILLELSLLLATAAAIWVVSFVIFGGETGAAIGAFGSLALAVLWIAVQTVVSARFSTRVRNLEIDEHLSLFTMIPALRESGPDRIGE